MAKIYAVRKGFKPGIYHSWDECKKQVHGFTGAEFKSFYDADEADTFMELGLRASLKDMIDYNEARDIKRGVYYKKDELARVLSCDPDTISIYTDGSCGTDTDGSKIYSGGYVIIKDKEIIHLGCTFGNKVQLAKLNNVAGEMRAVTHVLNHVKTNMPDIRVIHLFVDYTGLINWAKPKAEGGWSRNNPYTEKYGKFLEKMQEIFDIQFEHIKGHIGDPYNEEADALATYSKYIHINKLKFDIDEFAKNYSHMRKA